jgi:lipopolysaccharide export system permease protein
MLKKLDWYVIRMFLTTFVFVVLCLVAIISIIDFTEKNDDFIEKNVSKEQIFNYFINFIPYIVNLLTPITVFIATVFVTSRMASRSEIIAALAAGISFRRFMVPFLVGASVIAVLSFLLNGWVIPDSNKERIAFEVAYIRKPFYFNERDVHIKVSENDYAYLESYNNNADIGYRFTLETIKGNELKEKLSARRIEWDSANSKWRLRRWKKHTFNNLEESFDSGNILDTTLALHPDDFGSNFRAYETLTMPELNQHITKLRSRGADDILFFVVEKYIRYMTPFTVLILTFIGVIMSSRKTRGGSGFLIALGFMIAFVFIIFFILSRSTAEVGSMNPLLAVWLPNIIFSGIALLLYRYVPR